MTISDTITASFRHKLDEGGIDIRNTKTDAIIRALVTSGDFIADFTLGDQDTEESIQGVTWKEDAPKTGDVLIIDGKRYIVNSITSRPNGIITRFSSNLQH